MNIIVTRKKVIKEFANNIANLQKKADYHYYIKNDQQMSSYLLDRVMPLKNMCEELGIANQVYKEAYKIYNFKNSGKKDFVPDLELLRKCYQ